MSLCKLLPIPAEENFQQIRWKYFHKRVVEAGEYIVTTVSGITLDTIDLDTFSRYEPVRREEYVSPVQGMTVERGKLYIDNNDTLLVESVLGKPYPCGFHAHVEPTVWLAFQYAQNVIVRDFPRPSDARLSVPVPVLLSDVVAYGEQYDVPCVVARMMYVLTEAEADFLSRDHKPIQITEDEFEVVEV